MAESVPIEGSSLSIIGEVLRESFHSNDSTDLQIRCQDGEIDSHGLVWSAISPFFRQIFKEVDLSVEKCVVNIPDLSVDTIRTFLNHLFDGGDDFVDLSSELDFLDIRPDCDHSKHRLKTNETPNGAPISTSDIKLESKDFVNNEISSYNCESDQIWNEEEEQEEIDEEEEQIDEKEEDDDENEEEEDVGEEEFGSEKDSESSDSDEEYRPSEKVTKGIKRGKVSPVWKFYDRISKIRVKCKNCDTDLKTENGSTSSMRNHLRRAHQHLFNAMLKDDDHNPSSVQDKEIRKVKKEEINLKLVWNYFNKLDDDEVRCNVCELILKVSGKGSQQLIGHLKSNHTETYEQILTSEDEKVKSSSGKRSLVWDYFNAISKEFAACNICDFFIRTSGTSGMKNHLKHKHFKEFAAMMEKTGGGGVVNNNPKPFLLRNPGLKMSLTWNYFTRVSRDLANCNGCSAVIKTEGGSTTGMANHLKHHHVDKFVEMKEDKEKLLEDLDTVKGKDEFVNVRSVGRRSLAWNHFTPVQPDHASCNYCQAPIKTDGTTGMMNHLKHRHPEVHDEVLQQKGIKMAELETKRITTATTTTTNITSGKKKSLVWNYFGVIDKDYAACNECTAKIKTDGGSTTGMRNHLKYQHNEIFMEMMQEQASIDMIKSDSDVSPKKMKFTETELIERGLLPARKKSAIWKFFEGADEKDCSVCNICCTTVHGRNKNTSNMIRHLKDAHETEFEIFVEESRRKRERKVMLGMLDPKEVEVSGEQKKTKRPFNEALEDRSCDECQKVFSCSQSMLFHKKCVHASTSNKLYKCSDCNLEFTRADSYKSHIHASQVQQYLCQVCGKTFARKYIRDNHERAHFGDRRIKCNFCDKKFMTNQGRMKHERTHTGERPFQCQTCGKFFAQKHQLKTHNRIHTGEKPYSCKFCNQFFRHISSRNNHKCERKMASNHQSLALRLGQFLHS